MLQVDYSVSGRAGALVPGFGEVFANSCCDIQRYPDGGDCPSNAFVSQAMR